MSRRFALVLAVSFAVFSLTLISPVLFSAASAMQAAPAATASDDRENSAETNWSWVYGKTETEVNTLLGNTNSRLVDLQVETTTVPHKFAAAMVQNSGVYNKGWSWWYDQTPAQLTYILTSTNERIIALKAYELTPGDLRLAAVLISNSGADFKNWDWWFNQTQGSIGTNLGAQNDRLVQLSQYKLGSSTRYVIVGIRNTGADFKNWEYAFSRTGAQINTLTSSNNERVTDLDHDPDTGTFNVILEACPCPGWAYYINRDAAHLGALAAQLGMRIIDVNSYPGCGGLCFGAAFIDDANAVTSRVGALMRNGFNTTPNGITFTVGLYLKQVDGPVLANLEDAFVFEPASAIKITLMLYAMQHVQAGTAHIGDPVVHYNGAADICPDPIPPISGTERLDTALQQMMFNSDNTRTREISTTFGVVNINNNSAAIGMTHTHINHVIGCGGPIPDQMTLDDAGVIYEGIADGTLINDANRPEFWSLMAGKGYDFTGAWAASKTIIDQEAPAGMPASLKTAFENRMLMSYKAGGYDLDCTPTCTAYRAIAGYVSMPYCTGNGMTSRDYVWGTFIHGGLNVTTTNTVFFATDVEPLREQLHAAVASCYFQNLLPVIMR